MPCLACPAGWHQAERGETICTRCKPGATTGAHSEAGKADCTKCDLGKYYSNNTGKDQLGVCLGCPAGYFQDTKGLTKCKYCGKKTYGETENATSRDQCSQCPKIRSYTHSIASTNITDCLCDGSEYRWLGSAQDHKRVGEGDTGPNTGGMGAYTPAPCLTPDLENQVRRDIIEPSLTAMIEAGAPFQGILFAGIMLTSAGPQLLEYNVRFGDPEAQVILPRLGAHALDLFHAAASGTLAQTGDAVALADQHALTVVMATAGYPGDYQRGSEITLPPSPDSNVIIFHAGTRREGQRLLAAGGRVLTVTGLGDSLTQARERAYTAVDSIHWPEGFFRRDIGWRALQADPD